MPMDEDAQFVAVVGLFNRPDQKDNRWRLVLTRDDLDTDKPRTIRAGRGEAGALFPDRTTEPEIRRRAGRGPGPERQPAAVCGEEADAELGE